MNKTKLFPVITILIFALITTSLTGIVHALGKPSESEYFTLIPFVDDATIVGPITSSGQNAKWVGPVIEPFYPDGSFKNSRDTFRVYPPYQGPLGEGIMTTTTIMSMAKYQNPGLASGASTYLVTLDITGTYGTGRLEGIARVEWYLDFSSTPVYYDLWTMSLHGKGDINGLNVFVEAYGAFNPMPSYNLWWNTTISAVW